MDATPPGAARGLASRGDGAVVSPGSMSAALVLAGQLTGGSDAAPMPDNAGYAEARPAVETGCVRQFQTRSRTDSWEPWDSGPNEDQVFTELLCLVEEQRTRWRKMLDGCQSEVQSRYKDGDDDWSDWTGEFTDPTCTDTPGSPRSTSNAFSAGHSRSALQHETKPAWRASPDAAVCPLAAR